MIRASLNLKEFEAKLKVLTNPAAPQARALNRTLASAVTLGARLVSQDLGLQVGTVKKYFSSQKATYSNLTATLSASAKRIPISEFKARGPEPSRGRPGGVRASLPGGATSYPHAFITTMPSGHRGVYERKGLKRLPIRELRGPSIWQSFGKVENDVQARVTEQLAKNTVSEIAYALSQAR